MLSRKQRLFLFLEQVNTRDVSDKIKKKSKDIILELNCDAPVVGLIENVHVCKSNKLI